MSYHIIRNFPVSFAEFSNWLVWRVQLISSLIKVSINYWKLPMLQTQTCIGKIKINSAKNLLPAAIEHRIYCATFGFFTIRICQIIWQIWSYTEQNKFRQKLPPMGFELTTSGSSVSCFANWAKSLFGCGCYHFQHVKWCKKTKKKSLQKSPTDSSLAQLAEKETDDQEVVRSNCTGGNFWWNLFFAV